ncbi:VOC family protein [Nocardia sp. NBC_01329]|uniref:VOC family protein n=1 Tax=Nocardia sp. NBC_01329 TaxID=2903594 RepID=UPI002E14D376|nr:VOC family protein [Nocardia sp. NBC_01329]
MSDLRFVTVLSGIPVSDIGTSIAWYQGFFDRVPDIRPLEDVAEWTLNAGATLQLVERASTAGSGITRLEVENVNDAVVLLAQRGFTPTSRGEYSGVIRFADFSDPDGNDMSIVEALFDVPRFRAEDQANGS